MSNSRKELLRDMAEIFKSLSNVNRLQIYLRLATCCAPGTVCTADTAAPFCAGELGQGMDIAPSTLSHHLKELRRTGLIRMERRGQKVDCRVDLDTLQHIVEFFSHTAGTAA